MCSKPHRATTQHGLANCFPRVLMRLLRKQDAIPRQLHVGLPCPQPSLPRNLVPPRPELRSHWLLRWRKGPRTLETIKPALGPYSAHSEKAIVPPNFLYVYYQLCGP